MGTWALLYHITAWHIVIRRSESGGFAPLTQLARECRLRYDLLLYKKGDPALTFLQVLLKLDGEDPRIPGSSHPHVSLEP
jgi:hypothetical protein